MTAKESTEKTIVTSTTKVLQDSYKKYEDQMESMKRQQAYDKQWMDLLEEDLLKFYHTLKDEERAGNIQKRAANKLIQLAIHLQKVIHRDSLLATNEGLKKW